MRLLRKLAVVALSLFVLGLSDGRYPDIIGATNTLSAATQCALSTDPTKCDRVTQVANAADLATCVAGDLNNYRVCLVTQSIIVTDPAAVAAFTWVLRTDGSSDTAVVCRPGVTLALNLVADVDASKDIIRYTALHDATTSGSSLSIEGCNIEQYANGVSGGGTGAGSGVRFVDSGSGAAVATFPVDYVVKGNTIVYKSSGLVSFGVTGGHNSVLIDGNSITAQLPVEPNGEMSIISNNELHCTGSENQSGIGVQDSHTIAIDNRMFECGAGEFSNTSTSLASIEFRGTNIVNHPHREHLFIMAKQGTGAPFTVSGKVYVVDDATTTNYVDATLSGGGFPITDLELIFTGCPAVSEWLDVDGITGGTAPRIRVIGRIPVLCTVPAAGNMISGASDGELDSFNTEGIVKVGDETTATVSLLRGAAAPTDFTLADAIPRSTEVFCSAEDGAGHLALADSDAGDFSRGDEVAAYCDRLCDDVNLVVGGADSDCTTDHLAGVRIEVMGQ